MSEKIITLGIAAEDNRFLTPEQTLERALAELRNGEMDYNKLLILPLRHEGNEYHTSWYACNLSRSEMISLMTIITQRLAAEMNEAD